MVAKRAKRKPCFVFSDDHAATVRRMAGKFRDHEIGVELGRSAVWVGHVRRALNLPRWTAYADPRAVWNGERVERARKLYVDGGMTARQVAAHVGDCTPEDIERVCQTYGWKRDPEISRRNMGAFSPFRRNLPPGVKESPRIGFTGKSDSELISEWLVKNKPTELAPGVACGLSRAEQVFYAYNPASAQAWRPSFTVSPRKAA
jgi:hypothetical protein